MFRRILAGLALLLSAGLTDASAQVAVSVKLCVQTGPLCVPVTSGAPLPIAGTFSASVNPFQPSASGSRGTAFTVNTTDTSGTLPTGAVQVISNTGTNPMYCNVAGVAATTSDQLIPIQSWFSFAPQGGITTLHCIATGGTTTATLLGGSGLPSGAGGGSSAGGGGGGAVFGPTVVGSAAANPPVMIGGTANGSGSGTVQIAKVSASGLLSVDGSAVTQPISGNVGVTGNVTVVQPTAASLNATVVGTGTFAVQAAQSGTWNIGSITTLPPLVAGTAIIGKVGIDQTTPGTTNLVSIGTNGTVNPTTAASWGLGTTGSAVPSTAAYFGLNIGGNLVGATGLALGATTKAQATAIVDSSGNQLTTFPVSQATAANLNATVVGTGTFAVQANPGTPANWGIGAVGSAPPANAQLTGIFDGTNLRRMIGDETNGIWVNCKTGCGSGGGGSNPTDNTAFTAGTSTFGPGGGVFNDGLAAVTSGNQAAFRITTNRGLHSNLRNNSGTEVGTAASPLGVQLSQGNAVISAINGLYTNLLQGNAVLSASNPTFTQLTQSGAAVAVGNPTFTTISIGGSAMSSSNPLFANPGVAANWGIGAIASAPPANGVLNGVFDGTVMRRMMGDETNGIWVNVKAGSISAVTSGTQAPTTMQSAATANGNGTSLTNTSQGFTYALVNVNCSACGGGTTINFEGTDSTGNPFAVLALPITGGPPVTTTAASGQFYVPLTSLSSIRARISGYSAGTITVTGTPSYASVPVESVSSTPTGLPVGAATLTTNQVNVQTTATIIAAARTGVPGTGRQFVTICNTSTTAVFLGGSGVTTTNGQYLAGIPGACATFNITAAVYGIVASGTDVVAYSETY